MKRVSQFFFASAKDLAAGKRFPSRALVLNETTGELRRGPGTWAEMSVPGEGISANILATVAVTANTADSAMEAGKTLSGVVLKEGDVVLRTAQTNAAQNGLFLVGEEGVGRHPAYNTYPAHAGTVVSVASGDKAGAYYICTSGRTGTLDTTALAFAERVGGSFAPAPAAEVLATDLITLRSEDGAKKVVTAATLKAFMAAV